MRANSERSRVRVLVISPSQAIRNGTPTDLEVCRL
jgi:hypothetical protein